jgi:ribonuclease PH
MPTPKAISGLLYSGGKLIRPDNRASAELRPLEIIPNFISSAEGSALIRLGATQVICTASVDDGVPSFQKGSGRGWITSEYAMIPRATSSRTPRESTRGRQSGRTMEIQRLIGRSLRAVVDMEALGERTVWIDCDVIRADGGTRTASVTGALVALGLAIQKLLAQRALKVNPLKDYLAAISVGIVGGGVAARPQLPGRFRRRSGHERGDDRHGKIGGNPSHRRRPHLQRGRPEPIN